MNEIVWRHRQAAVCAVRVCQGKEENGMYRFFVAEENRQEERILITGDDVNHIRNVLRMAPGERVVVSCGKGVDYECEIDKLGEAEIQLVICQETPAVTELPVEITLFQALPKKDKMELVIQKAIELGAVHIVPVETKRCVVKLDARKKEKKLSRWRAVAEAAAKQSGRGIVPQVHPVQTFSQALQMAEAMDLVLIPYELYEDMASSVKRMVKAVEKSSIGIFIGPEGGFERGEVEKAVAGGAYPISLGKRILRTETAGLAVLSILMFLIEGKNDGGKQDGMLSG